VISQMVIIQRDLCFYFFFSSRRRHTRSKRDWSSDVCSSDLAQPGTESEPASVVVLAGPDSGFTLTVDPRRAQLSRLPHDSSLTIIDPCLSRTPTPLAINA